MRRLEFLSMVVASLMVLGGSASAVAAPRSVADYPMRVHIYSTHWNANEPVFYGWDAVGFGYYGYGRANLMEGDNTNAMEYTFACDRHFMKSDPGEAFPAKWKKQGSELEMLMTDIGSNKTTTCRLKVTLRDYVYHRVNGKMVTLTQEEYKQRESHLAERAEALAPADADRAHYPMEFSLLDVSWSPRNGGMYLGMGHGNLKTAEGISSVDFSIACPVEIKTTPEGRFYGAKWVDDGHQMDILLHKVGDEEAAATCSLKTQLHGDVYVVESAGVLKTVSQERYKTLRAADAEPR